MAPRGEWETYQRAGEGWRGGRGRGSGGSSSGKRETCRFFQQGKCQFGESCRFSHDLPSTAKATFMSSHARAKPEQTAEELTAREDYISWKRLLRAPPRHGDSQTVKALWSGALELLNNGERDWQQRLPHDLVDEEHLFGYQHIQEILNTRPNTGSDAGFVQLARPFLMVITHPALLDCLSVDIYVGDLYNFVSGSGGTRAVPFFQSLIDSLLAERMVFSEIKSLEDTLVAISTALREMLRRTSRRPSGAG